MSTQAEAFAVPEALKKFAHRITDIDSHEMLPAQEWASRLGPELAPMADYYMEREEDEETDRNTCNIAGYAGDVLEVDGNIASVKGARAPGAVDPSRRIAVMKAMGIRRQLLYPSNPAVRILRLHQYADDTSFMPFAKGSPDERKAMSRRLIALHNEELIDAVKVSDMIRPVPLLYGDTPDEMIERARDFIKRGVRAVWLAPSGELPGGRSPAHPDLDPLWEALSEADCVLTLHSAADGNYLGTEGWQDAPNLSVGYLRHVEIIRSPWFLATLHMAIENFLTVLILGGVFDRFPKLRFGAIEAGAFWVGPLMERLDLWHGTGMSLTKAKDTHHQDPYRLPEKPSFYVERNCRFTPFFFENVASYIERYQGMENVLCYSSDYPHVEGGRENAAKFHDNIAHLGAEIMEKFFVTNGEWLLPD